MASDMDDDQIVDPGLFVDFVGMIVCSFATCEDIFETCEVVMKLPFSGNDLILDVRLDKLGLTKLVVLKSKSHKVSLFLNM